MEPVKSASSIPENSTGMLVKSVLEDISTTFRGEIRRTTLGAESSTTNCSVVETN